MKKIYLTLLASVFVVSASRGQWVQSGDNMILGNGNVGIGVTNPLHKLSIGGPILITVPGNSPNGAISMSNGAFLSLEAFNSDNSVKFPVLLSPYGGRVGVGTINPVSVFQVGDGPGQLNIGNAYGQSLNYGTSYLGFNAAKGTNGWNVNTDGANNGGGIMYNTIFGDFYLASIESTGATNKVLSDADVKSRIKLHISSNGTLYSKTIVVRTEGWPDYVFNKDYSLLSLKDTKAFIDKHHHLPDAPSAEEVAKEGINLGEMNKLLLKKVEELTLYLIEKDKKEKELEERVRRLEGKNKM